MSVDYSEEPEYYDIDAIVEKVKRSPTYEDGEFSPNKSLFDNLRSLDIVTYSNQDFKIVNLFGPYQNFEVPDDCLVLKCGVQSSIHLLKLIKDEHSTTFVHPEAASWIEIHSSSEQTNEALVFQLKKIKKLKHLSKKQISLLRFLKKRLGLSYLHCPSSWGDFSTTEDNRDSLLINLVAAEEFGSSLDCLSQTVDQLRELGLLRVSRVREGEEYVLGDLYTSCPDLPAIGAALGIPPGPSCDSSTLRSLADLASAETLFAVTLVRGSVQYDSRVILDSLVNMTCYVLDISCSCTAEYEYQLEYSGHRVQIRLIENDILFKSSDKKVKYRLQYAVELAIRHLNIGSLQSDVEKSTGMEIRVIQEPGGSLVTSALLETEHIEKPVNRRCNTSLGNVSVLRVKLLVEALKEEEMKVDIPVTLFSAVAVHTTVEELEHVQKINSLINQHHAMTLLQFYRKHRKTHPTFCQLLIKSHELNEEHMKTRTDSIKNNAWWIATGIIGFVLAIITILLSYLYEVDVGYGGLAGVAAFVVVSGLVKKICTKDQQGYRQDLTDEEVVNKCQNCFSA